MLEFWKKMFMPSALRKQFESAVRMRSHDGTITWLPIIESGFANRVLQLIEESADWPRGKLRPTDPVLLVFQGKADSDLAFAMFASRFNKLFGANLTQRRVLNEIDVDTASIEDFVIALLKIREVSSATECKSIC
jgi:hypothetical protein